MKHIPTTLVAVAVLLGFAACSQDKTEWVSTTFETPWTVQAIPAAKADGGAGERVVVDSAKTLQAVEGFGTCFNELGWTSLSELSEADRTGIIRDLFSPEGLGLTMARMPVGANDFSVDYYSYDDTPGDLALEHFSIAHDEQTLLPFIRAALAAQPDLRIWASPWCPPAWMKVNGHYANTSTLPIKQRFEQMMKNRKDRPDDVRATGGSSFGMNPAVLPDNGLPLDAQIREGQDAFRLEPEYLEAYARYFGKFIDAYRAEGIDIRMVMPQNEPNSAQWYPACTWTPEGLAQFIACLGPEMQKRGVEVWLGTVERADPEMWDRILTDPKAGPYISGMGFQWAGKDALPELHRRHPELPCYQTEQECGNGSNDWAGAMHAWDLMRQYWRGGVTGYFYWNTSLLDGGVSTWGWSQNSLVAVDKQAHTFRYTPEYYILKHASHYVQPGARVLDLGGSYEEALGFLNPDGRTVLLLANKDAAPKTVSVELSGRVRTFELPAGSVNTLVL